MSSNGEQQSQSGGDTRVKAHIKIQEEIVQYFAIGKMISNNIISSVYSPFSDGIGLPLHTIPSSEGLIKTIGEDFSIYNRMPFLASTTCAGDNNNK